MESVELWEVVTGHLLLQNNEIVKIQSLLRASKARDDYKTLGKWSILKQRIPYKPSKHKLFPSDHVSGRTLLPADFDHLRSEHVMTGNGPFYQSGMVKGSRWNFFFKKNGQCLRGGDKLGVWD